MFWWTRRHGGLPAATLALALCVFSPDLLAHGPLVTTDVGAALFIFLTVACFERVTAGATPLRVLAAGLSLGAAVSTKFSSLSLGPILAALAAMVVTSVAPIPVRVFGRRRTLATRHTYATTRNWSLFNSLNDQ